MLTPHHTGDPVVALRSAEPYLLADPVAANIALTVLESHLVTADAGHYWWVSRGRQVVGFAFQSPPTFPAGLVEAEPEVIDALVDAIHDTTGLPGVTGEAGSAARFAGRWTRRAGVGARPTEGGRRYVLGRLRVPASTLGPVRLATSDDLDLATEWSRAFTADTGMESPADPARAMGHSIDGRTLYLGEVDGAAVAMTRATSPVGGVSRIGWVYTPPSLRGRGYASALVAAVSAQVMAEGVRTCILYTQLSNPTSNGIYAGIGYEPTAEVLSYRFDQG